MFSGLKTQKHVMGSRAFKSDRVLCLIGAHRVSALYQKPLTQPYSIAPIISYLSQAVFWLVAGD